LFTFAKKCSILISITALGLVGITAIPVLYAQAPNAQTPPKPEPDVLTTTNGEKLIGHLVRSAGASVTFHSDTLGDLTVPWSKIQELHSPKSFAVIRKGVELHREADAAAVAKGTIAMTGQTIAVNPGGGQAAQSIPVADAGYVVEAPYFESILEHNPRLVEDWNGTVTAGGSLLQATQDNRTVFGSISLVRAIPPETWLAARNRTIVNFSASDGVLTQPNTPKVKTSIYHAAAERDQYFSSRVYAFGQTTFDHNYSQGLSLQQAYGGGIGWTVIEAANQTFDLKAGVNYERQDFQTVAARSLAGSTFAEHYHRTLPRGIIFDEILSFVPAWNDTNAYWASFNTSLTMPVYKRLSLTAGVIDTFLNDPPPGFKKNSFQFTTGLTYALR
jgi:Protein of unknown function, DUF481